MEPIEIPGLARNEQGYQDEHGNRVAVRVARRGDVGERFAAFEVQARVVDGDGQTVREGGVPAQTPTHTVSVNFDAIVAGHATIEDEVGRACREQARRALRHRAAIAAYLKLPG